jgi:hypothetical protein
MTTKSFMILRSYRRMKKQVFVMPAWMAGIQARGNASEDIHVTWVPALHAGTT